MRQPVFDLLVITPLHLLRYGEVPAPEVIPPTICLPLGLAPCIGVGKSQPVLKTDEDNALTANVHEHIMRQRELNTKESNNVGCFKV